MSAQRSKQFHPMSAVLDRFYSEWGLKNEMERYRLARHWGAVVGDTLARHSFPEKIRFRTLTLGVDSAPWMNELLFFKGEIIQKTNQFFNKTLICDLTLKIIAPYPQKAFPSQKKKDIHPPPDITPFEEGLNALQDREIQETIRQAVLRYFSSSH